MNFAISIGGADDHAAALRTQASLEAVSMKRSPPSWLACQPVQRARQGAGHQEARPLALKFCISGGAPLPLEVKREFERMSGCKLVEGYGLSETSPVTHINPVGGPGQGGLHRPARARHDHVAARPRRARARKCRWARKARFASAGPQVMKGYWKKPAETGDDLYRRVLPHRRCRLHGQRRLHLHRRPHQGPHSLLGLQRLSAPYRGGDLRASGRGGSDRDRRPRPVSRRSAEGVREASRWPARHGRGRAWSNS